MELKKQLKVVHKRLQDLYERDNQQGTATVIHAGHARPQKHRVQLELSEFLFNYSKTRHQKRTRHSLKSYVFLFLRFLHFWRENDVTNCVPKFGFANMGYLMSPFERTFHKDLKTEKKF